MAKRIEVRAGEAANVIAVTEPYDTIKDAKCRAKYLASNAYARRAEMSEPFAFVAVYLDDEMVITISEKSA